MLIKKTQPEPTKLEKTIDRLLTQMAEVDCESKEYAAMADQVSKLYKLKESDIPQQVSKDTLLLVAGNLAGILLIIAYENKNVIASKALGFVMKPR
jgi:hypothetical protein